MVAVVAMIMLFGVVGFFASEEQAPKEAEKGEWEAQDFDDNAASFADFAMCFGGAKHDGFFSTFWTGHKIASLQSLILFPLVIISPRIQGRTLRSDL